MCSISKDSSSPELSVVSDSLLDCRLEMLLPGSTTASFFGFHLHYQNKGFLNNPLRHLLFQKCCFQF